VRDELSKMQNLLTSSKAETDELKLQLTKSQNCSDEYELENQRLKRENASLVLDLERARSAKKQLEDRWRQDQVCIVFAL
jgi:regulator of replication initiation timing